MTISGRSRKPKGCECRGGFQEMKERGVTLMATGRKPVAEEMPEAYKDLHSVVDMITRAGISEKVARLRPVGVIKG